MYNEKHTVFSFANNSHGKHKILSWQITLTAIISPQAFSIFGTYYFMHLYDTVSFWLNCGNVSTNNLCNYLDWWPSDSTSWVDIQFTINVDKIWACLDCATLDCMRSPTWAILSCIPCLVEPTLGILLSKHARMDTLFQNNYLGRQTSLTFLPSFNWISAFKLCVKAQP